MDKKTFHLTVITPERVSFDGPVRSIVAPGGAGRLGVLVDHAPLITTLSSGRLDLTLADGGAKSFVIGPGFLDIFKNQAILLTDSAQIGDPT